MAISLQEKRREYYLANKEWILKKRKARYKANPNPELRCNKKYAKKNPNRIKAHAKTWLRKNPDKRKLFTRNSRIRAYGISPETYYEMLEKQGHRCAICNAESTRRAMNIDHEHETGKVRGLLCDGCNLSLGHLERKGFVEKAMQYLAKYK